MQWRPASKPWRSHVFSVTELLPWPVILFWYVFVGSIRFMGEMVSLMSQSDPRSCLPSLLPLNAGDMPTISQQTHIGNGWKHVLLTHLYSFVSFQPGSALVVFSHRCMVLSDQRGSEGFFVTAPDLTANIYHI